VGTDAARGSVRVRPARRLVRTAAVALAGFAAMGVAVACEPAECTTNFVTAASFGSWDDPMSWSGGTVPTASDIACIGAGWNVELPVGGAVTVKGLKTASNLVLAQSSLTILNSQIQGAPTARFFLGQGSSITIRGGTGNLTLDGGELSGSGDVHGTVSGASKVSPGDPFGTDVGVLTVHGDLILDATVVPIDLSGNGTVAGVGHDRVAVTGALTTTANTVVDIRAGATFAPVAHTTISPFTATSVSGSPQVGVPDYGGTGTYLARSSAGTGFDLYGTDCDPWTYGPYTTYTASLAGKDLRLCQLYTSSFAGVDLSAADLSEAILWDASFTSANLTGADLTRAEVGGADLSTATLTGIRSGSTQGVPLLPAGWSAVGGYLVGPGANLTGVDLTELDLTGVSLAGTNLTGADLSGIDLTGKDLTGATLTGADVTGTNLTGTVLTGLRSGAVVGTPAALPAGWFLRSGFLAGPGADFAAANLVGVNLSGVNLAGSDFSGANVNGANLNANLAGVRSGATVGNPSALPLSWWIRGGFLVGPQADLSGKTLTGTNLSSVNLSGATFTNATLVNVNVSGSNWFGANAIGIKGKNLTGFPSTMPPNLDVVSGFFFGPNVNLSGEVLQNLDLTARVYSLAGANLTNTGITSSNLYRLQLQNANLTGATITNSFISLMNMTGANMGGLPVGATFGSGLNYNGTLTTMTPPAGWVLQATGIFGSPPYRLLRQS